MWQKNSLSGAHEAMTLFSPRSSLMHARSAATQCTRSAKGEERAVASRRLTHRRIPRARRAQLNGASARERPSDRLPLSIQNPSHGHGYKHNQRKRSILISDHLWLHFLWKVIYLVSFFQSNMRNNFPINHNALTCWKLHYNERRDIWDPTTTDCQSWSEYYNFYSDHQPFGIHQVKIYYSY